MYAPPAVELPNTRQIVGICDCERRVRSRNPRPPGTKIFDCTGRSAPADSIIEIDGRWLCSAMSLNRPDFHAVISLTAPPLELDALARQQLAGGAVPAGVFLAAAERGLAQRGREPLDRGAVGVEVGAVLV